MSRIVTRYIEFKDEYKGDSAVQQLNKWHELWLREERKKRTFSGPLEPTLYYTVCNDGVSGLMRTCILVEYEELLEE